MTFQRRILFAAVVLCFCPVVAVAQSLHIPAGHRAVEAGIGWSVGPFSDGVELVVGASSYGRLDIGIGLASYTYTFDDGFESKFKEYAPFVRFFPVKQQSGAPVSLSFNAQLFIDDYTSDEDSGKYVQVGTTAYKEFALTEEFRLIPFAGFAFTWESYSFGGAPADRAHYLTRDFGLHFTTSPDRAWIGRFTVAEQSFRRETYRGARVALVRRF